VSAGARPFLKYAGGKSQLLPELLKRVPPSFNCYHEPFVGGGALFFALAPKRAVLCDANERLVRTYKAVRDNVDNVIDALKAHAVAHSRDYYMHVRDANPDVATNWVVAAWFIYLNKTAFNGLYRVNKSGHFNVPFGKYANPKIVDEENLRACSEALQAAVIRHADFRTSLEWPVRGDFCYCDSPYVPLSNTSLFTSYTTNKFGAEDQRDLAALASVLKRDGVNVLLSNSSAPSVIEDLYPSFQVEPVEARRSINSNGSKRGAIREYLIR
jgi:DNA adenine methylase